MKLRILMPFCVFMAETAVSRIVAETGSGSFGILPHRVDCVAALVPGILVYEIREEGEVFLAIAEGILIKTGLDVLISVRNVIGGSDLKLLNETVEKEFKVLSDYEQNVRSVMSRMESAFIRRITAFNHG